MRTKTDEHKIAIVAALQQVGGTAQTLLPKSARTSVLKAANHFFGHKLDPSYAGKIFDILRNEGVISEVRSNGSFRPAILGVTLIDSTRYDEELVVWVPKHGISKALVPAKQPKAKKVVDAEQDELDQLLEQISKRLILNKLHTVLNNL